MVGVLAGTIRPPFAERAKSVTPRSISLASRASIELISTPRNGPTAWIAPNCPLPEGMLGSRMTAARVTPGEICLSNSSHFPLMPYSMLAKPVALPPGRAKLAAKPPPTGSPAFTNTMGRVRVFSVQRHQARVAADQNNVRRERDQFRRRFANAFGVTGAPAILQPHIATIGPAQFLQSLQKCSDTGKRFRIVRSRSHQHANAPRSL